MQPEIIVFLLRLAYHTVRSIYLLIILTCSINQPGKEVEMVVKEEVGAGDGARTRDSLLGRQELYH